MSFQKKKTQTVANIPHTQKQKTINSKGSQDLCHCIRPNEGQELIGSRGKRREQEQMILQDPGDRCTLGALSIRGGEGAAISELSLRLRLLQ